MYKHNNLYLGTIKTNNIQLYKRNSYTNYKFKYNELTSPCRAVKLSLRKLLKTGPGHKIVMWIFVCTFSWHNTPK